jgi:cytochrome P450
MAMQLEDPYHVNDLVSRFVAREPGKPGMTEDGMQARLDLMHILTAEAARRRAGKGPESPIIDPLLKDNLIGRIQRDEEIASDLLAILVGGAETVPKVFCGGMLELQRHPEQLAAVRTDPAANARIAVEEMLRYNAPAQWFGRTVRKAVTLGGIELEPGQRVILSIAAANRDEREFEDPDAFVWNRKARRMLSFGVGPHFCIGIHLARLELQVLVREFFMAAKDFTIHPQEGEWAVSEFQIGWLKLPVTVGQMA